MTDATTATKKDTRFFPGHTWVSHDPDCRLGLCMPSTDPVEAATMFLRPHNTYYNRGRTIPVYTMAGPDDTPTRVEVVL